MTIITQIFFVNDTRRPKTSENVSNFLVLEEPCPAWRTERLNTAIEGMNHITTKILKILLGFAIK